MLVPLDLVKGRNTQFTKLYLQISCNWECSVFCTCYLCGFSFFSFLNFLFGARISGIVNTITNCFA